MLPTLHLFANRLANFAVWALVFSVVWMANPHAAYAQTVTSYVRTDNGTINADEACTASPLVRTFNVTDSFIISDVDLGVIVQHTWRGDLRIELTSPSNTTVRMTEGDINAISGNNFNVLLDDDADDLVNTDGNTRNQSSNENVQFQNTYRPDNALSAFIGQNSAGTWTLEICDLFPSDDDGQFRYAELFLTDTPPNAADLSLSKSVSNTNPAFGSTVSYTLTLNNDGPATASNVEVSDNLPVGFDYVSSSGFGTFNPATGIWSVPSVAAGQTRVMTITGIVSAPTGVTITNFAEISASDSPDIDSTPGNNSANEDDDDSASFTVQGNRTAGVAPILSCPAGTFQFDWDASNIVWQAGVLNQTFSVANFGDVSFAITNEGTFENDANFGGLSPAESTINSGGLPGSQSALNQFIDFANRDQVASTVITLPNVIAGAQFTIFDVDFGVDDFADKVTVTGSLQGATVIPELTNGTANYVVGNTAIGDAGSGGTSGAANVVVTFNQPIDTITIVYGNAPTAPIVPDGQAIAIHDFDFCAPQTQLSVTKVSSIISDPFNPAQADAKAIPGAVVEYVIQVSNTGVSSAQTVTVADTHSGDTKLCRINDTGGPVTFTEPGGPTGLTYSSASDLIYLDSSGSPLSGVPTADADGCDANVAGFRITPQGSMNGGTFFSLRIRYRLIDSATPTQ